MVVLGVKAQDSTFVAPMQSVGSGSLDSMQYLNEVVAYGRKPYEEVIPAQTLSGKQLEGLGALSVADAIRYFSGVQLKDYGGVGGLKTVDIRSMGSNHMGVFYDGIQLGNAQNGQVDLGKFSLDNIEQIDLYNGQRSTIFSSAKDFGSSGSIYLRTRRPKFAAGRRDNLSVTFRTGSFGLVNPSVRWEHKFSQRLSAAANAEFTYATGKYKFRYHKRYSDGSIAWDTTATRQNGDIHALRVEGSLFGLMERGSWYTKLYYYNSEKGIPGAIVNNVWHHAQRQWDRNFFAQGNWQNKYGERWELMVNAKYAHDYLRYHNPDTTLLYVDNKFWQDEIYISSANKCKILEDFARGMLWEADLSVDYQWNHLRATLQDFPYPTRHTLLTALATAFTIHRFKAQASLLSNFFSDRSTPRSGDVVMGHRHSTKHRFTPAVFLSYQPWAAHDLNLRTFFKRAFRMPTFNDLYYTDVGNISLQPEYATQWNVGLLYRRLNPQGFLAGVKVSVDAYYNRITDKIIAVPKGTGQYRWMMMNLGKVKIRGVDVSARATMRLARSLTADVNLSYTYQRAQDYSYPSDNGDGGTYKGQIAYVPWHSGSVVGHVNWRDLDVNYSFIYVGERYHTSANTRENHEQPWYTHDVSASYVFHLGATRLKLSAEVNNLFDQQYDVILNYPMPGRNYRFTLRFEL